MPALRVKIGITPVAAWAPIMKSGSSDVFVPPRRRYCTKALPARNKAGLGNGTNLNCICDQTSSKACRFEKVVDRSVTGTSSHDHVRMLMTYPPRSAYPLDAPRLERPGVQRDTKSTSLLPTRAPRRISSALAKYWAHDHLLQPHARSLAWPERYGLTPRPG